MQSTIAICLSVFTAITASLVQPVQLQAAIIPPIGLAPGSPYQLVFVTAGSIDATSPNESTYNTFVQNQAALNPLLPESVWHAVTSTADGTNAQDNAPSAGLPVYTTQGNLVSQGPLGLYALTHDAPISADQFGLSIVPNYVWTGMGPIYTQLGNQYPETGAIIPYYPVSWNSYGYGDPTYPFPIYALSDQIFLPVPEPSSIIMWIVAMGVLTGAHLRRRK